MRNVLFFFFVVCLITSTVTAQTPKNLGGNGGPVQTFFGLDVNVNIVRQKGIDWFEGVQLIRQFYDSTIVTNQMDTTTYQQFLGILNPKENIWSFRPRLTLGLRFRQVPILLSAEVMPSLYELSDVHFALNLQIEPKVELSDYMAVAFQLGGRWQYDSGFRRAALLNSLRTPQEFTEKIEAYGDANGFGDYFGKPSGFAMNLGVEFQWDVDLFQIPGFHLVTGFGKTFDLNSRQSRARIAPFSFTLGAEIRFGPNIRY